jgi:FtsZ-binding cell division protein ZapB
MNDPTPTPVPQSLLVQLVASISDLSGKVEALSERVDKAQSDRRALAADVRCLADGMKSWQEMFRAEFEPYLKDAVRSQNTWRERRSSLLTKVLGAGVLAAIGFICAAVWHYALDIVSSWK